MSAGDTQQELVYRVTNTGNGPETFRLVMNSVLDGRRLRPGRRPRRLSTSTRTASGDLSPRRHALRRGSNDPVLNADAFVTVLVVNNIPATVVDGNRGLSRLTADARTGTGTPGTTFAGQGAGGTDAVVGTTGADGDATGAVPGRGRHRDCREDRR